MHVFDCTFGCAFHKSNVCGSHANANVLGMHANALKKLWRHSNAHLNAFAFVNKPDWQLYIM